MDRGIAILAVLLAWPALAQNTVSLSGTVMDAVRGLPIEDAAVRLLQSNDPNAQMTFTDAAGNYTFEKVFLGTASVTVEARGFLDFKGARPIEISANDAVHNFVLVPGSSITGQISAEDGTSLGGNVFVCLYREDFTDGVEHFSAGGDRADKPSTTIIQRDGSFKITGLPAGRYILSAGPPFDLSSSFVRPTNNNPISFPASAPSSLGHSAEGYVQTYFPGTTDFTAAVPISLEAGSTINVNFRMPKRPLFRASGKFLAPDVKSMWEGTVQVVSVGDGVTRHTYTGTVSAGEGAFAVEGLPPGQYVMTTIRSSSRVISKGDLGTAISFSAIPVSLSFVITDHNIEGLKPVPLPRSRAFSLRGIFRMANTHTSLPTGLSIRLSDPEPGGKSIDVPVAATGEFRIDGVSGDHSVEPTLPYGYAVVEVRLDSSNYLNSLIPIKASSNFTDTSLVIVLTDQPGSIAGSIKDKNGNPVAAKVALLPIPLPKAFDFRAIAVVTTDKQGSFSFLSIAPGKYKAVALTNETDQKRDHDMAILGDKLRTAESFEVVAGQSQNIFLQP